jgi:hypothetical protein
MESRIPTAIIELKTEDPPYESMGIGTPATGAMPIVIPKFNAA